MFNIERGCLQLIWSQTTGDFLSFMSLVNDDSSSGGRGGWIRAQPMVREAEGLGVKHINYNQVSQYNERLKYIAAGHNINKTGKSYDLRLEKKRAF